jgi:predicted Fe-S protein YdhL (DUF1289 family)
MSILSQIDSLLEKAILPRASLLVSSDNNRLTISKPWYGSFGHVTFPVELTGDEMTLKLEKIGCVRFNKEALSFTVDSDQAKRSIMDECSRNIKSAYQAKCKLKNPRQSKSYKRICRLDSEMLINNEVMADKAYALSKYAETLDNKTFIALCDNFIEKFLG